MKKRIISLVLVCLLIAVSSCGDRNQKSVLVPLDGAIDLFGGVTFDVTEEDFLNLKPDIGAPVTDDEVVIDGIPAIYYSEKIDENEIFTTDHMYVFHDGSLYALKTGYTLKKTGDFSEDEIYTNFQLSIDNVMNDLLVKLKPEGEFEGENQRYSPQENKQPIVMGGWKVGDAGIMLWASPNIEQNFGRIVVMYGQE